MPRLGDPCQELVAVELQTPAPSPGVVRIRVDASELNFADCSAKAVSHQPITLLLGVVKLDVPSSMCLARCA